MPTNKFTKNSVTTRSAKGKASVQKGTKFQDTIADVYRLLGAEVIQNIEICQKKVDILGTFQLPGSPTGHRVIVECKDEKKVVRQNQRVMEFKGLLETARKSGEADSAEIITRVPWSDQAKGFARDSGIALLTYAEKMAQLIDFTGYLKGLVERFEKGHPYRQSEPPLGAYYVDLSAELITQKGTERIDVIDTYINQWIHRDNTRHLAILGEYGTGKTALCQKLAHDLSALYLKEPGSTRIPILFSLREFTKTLKIEALVTSFLDEECGVINPRYKLFQAMNEAGILLLIFDGFDEMAVRVDVDTLEINLQEIEKLAAYQKSKVIITSRLEYFISGEEEKKSLSPKGELLATREIEYEPLKIVPWREEQVDSFLRKRVPLIKGATQPWTYYRDRIRDIPGLSDLSRRPVLLDMIVKTLPQLIASGKPINRPNLYETYLLGEIKRQKIMKKRTLLLSEDTRFSLLQQLALDFFGGEILAITFSDSQRYIEKFVKPPGAELEAYTRDFLTCSFLMREGDKYRFSHRSIMEYLAAKALKEEIDKNTPATFALQRLDPVVTGFLAELSPDIDRLWNWLESTKSSEKEDIKYLGGNAATLLCRIDRTALAGRDLSRANLMGADLSFADLRGTNLTGTLVKNVKLVNAQFLKKDLTSARISDVTVSLLFFGHSKKQGEELNKKERYLLHKLYHEIVGELSAHRKIQRPSFRYHFAHDPDNYFLMRVVLEVPDSAYLELIQSKASGLSEIQAISLYANEYEELFVTIPKSLVPFLHDLITDIEHYWVSDVLENG
jgi:hypothetical protein